MKFIISSFIIALALTGCDKSDEFQDDNVDEQIQQEAVSKDSFSDEQEDAYVEEEDDYEEQAKTDEIEEEEQKREKQVKTDLILPSNDRSFSSIKRLIQASGNGSIDDVTYICVGDSTRADSSYGGVYLFRDVRDRLSDYNVKSYLHARAGHKAQEFNSDYGSSPTWRDVVDDIPGDGRDCIVDISLGINDSWSGDGSFDYSLRSAINKIKGYKPNTHFMLTMPDRVYGNSDMTNRIKGQYQELSYDLNIPLVDIVEDIMPSQDSTSYSLYRDDGFNVHLSREGQRRVANDILSHMLPN